MSAQAPALPLNSDHFFPLQGSGDGYSPPPPGGENPPSNSCCGGCFGRVVTFFRSAVTYIGNKINETADKVVVVSRGIITGLDAIKNDPDALVKVFKLIGNGLMVLQTSGVVALEILRGRTDRAVNLIEAFGLLADIPYFVSGDWKDDNAFYVAGRILFAGANVAGLGLWLEELGFGLSRVAAAIGTVRYFSFVPLIPIGTIVSGVVGVGFIFLGADAIWRLKNTIGVSEAQDPSVNAKRIKAVLDLSCCAFEVTAKVIVVAAAVSLIPAAPPAVIFTLGCAAAGFGIASFVYGVYNRKALAAV